jgi:hypothetical protein
MAGYGMAYAGGPVKIFSIIGFPVMMSTCLRMRGAILY